MDKYIAIEEWESSYPNPLVLTKGEHVIIDTSKTDDNPEWSNWVWCISPSNQGWAPEQILEILDNSADRIKASVKEDYTAIELNIEVGEIVTGHRILNGWLWCTKVSDNETGWLPLECLKLM
ncbi:MAG: SH3 domain-containing protein [Dysgonomonas sp.]|nr:SH3 domain-containing protein [Dysgonomonas sp.]